MVRAGKVKLRGAMAASVRDNLIRIREVHRKINMQVFDFCPGKVSVRDTEIVSPNRDFSNHWGSSTLELWFDRADKAFAPPRRLQQAP